jgi:xanthine dehydrogenase accessory factor
MQSFLEAAFELEKNQQSFVIVTLTQGRGHIPQDPGAKMIVTPEGISWGTVGGGKVEARAIAFAQEYLASQESAPKSVVWNLQKDIGMTCGGEVTYLFEALRPNPWVVRIFGAGHVAQSLVRAMSNLPVSITCIDTRHEWLARLPGNQKNLKVIHAEDLAGWIDHNIHSPQEFFVSLTQGHAADVPVLSTLFKKFLEPRYIGVIGSETKGIKIRAELESRGISKEQLQHLRVPIGLDLGTNHPAEIAISIAAELLMVRDAKKDSKGTEPTPLWKTSKFE